MKYFVLVLLFSFPLMSIASGEDLAGESLVKQFFSQEGIDNKTTVYTGEMLSSHFDKPTFGQSLPADVKTQQRLLQQTDNHAVYAVTLSRGSQSQDWYVYLIQERKVWKLSALRNFVIPKPFFIATHTLSEKTDRNAEEEYTYQNQMLAIRSDIALKEYAIENQTLLSTIVTQATSDSVSANAAAKSLFLQHVNYNKEKNITNITIVTIARSGNIASNTMGYMHIPENKNIPEMSEDGYIYIENIVGDWFIYKKKNV